MSTQTTVQDALTAIEDGRLSVEEVMNAAVRGRAALRDWLGARVKMAPATLRRVQVRTTRQFNMEVVTAAVQAMRTRYGRFAGITSIHWGVRRRHGRLCAENAVVVHCVAKWPKASLARKRRLPKSISVRVSGRRYTLPVDVKAVGAVATAQSVSSAAAAASRAVWMDQVAGPQTGALGALVTDGQGAVRAVLSGHVALHEQRLVFVGSTASNAARVGTVAKVVRDSDSDIAWTTPLALSAQIATRKPGPPRDPTSNDVRASVTVLVARDFAGVRSFIEDVGVSTAVQFSDGSVVNMTGLFTLSPAVTLPGDSGSPVVDFNDRLIGFVVGAAADKSYIVPARRALNDLEA